MDELIEFDIDVKEIEDIIKNTDKDKEKEKEKETKVNWTNAWSKKYSVLATYT